MAALRDIRLGAGAVRTRALRWTLPVLCAAFLAGHLIRLVSAPTDVDEANFVLGVRQFDVATHRPHPPGYPVFIVLARLARPVARLWPPAPLAMGGEAAVEARALALWSAVLGALALVPLFVVFRALEDRRDAALAATAVTAASPVYWFAAARPLSDIPGLAAALAVDALLLSAWRDRRAAGPASEALGQRRFLAAALAAGLAAGLRSQTLWLTAPLFVFVAATWRGPRGRLIAQAVGVWAVGVLLWAVPMLVATGGTRAYLDALQWQARDDFAGVPMLVSELSSARWTAALRDSFIMVWATRDFARVLLGLAGIGVIVLAVRGRAVLGLLAIAFVPYAAFHLLFHETPITRYALPLVPPIAYLAVRGLQTVIPRVLPVTATLLVTALLVVTLPAFLRYTREATPVFAALGEVERLRSTPQYARAVVASHQAFARALEATNLRADRVLPAPLMAEWLELADYWRSGGVAPVLFLRDPRRGSLDLVDPASRTVLGRYRWRFSRQRFIGGVRPDLADLVAIDSPPGWFCGDGWHLTPESLGVTQRRGKHDAFAFVRRRPEAAVAVFGADYVMTPGAPAEVGVSASLDGRPLARWTLSAARRGFFQPIDLPAGSLEGAGPYAEIVLRHEAIGGGILPDVQFTRFDLQSVDKAFLVLGPGWHEREYNVSLDRDWWWTSERATFFVQAAGRDLTLRLAGESPLRYFDAAPHVSVRAGDQVLARFSPSADFSQEIAVPAAALAQSRGFLILETDRTFVPADSSTSADRRHLGLRVFEISIK